MTTQVFSIDGLHCHGCVQTVNSAISGLPAVKSVDVDLDTKGTSKVTVEAEPPVSRDDVQAISLENPLPDRVDRAWALEGATGKGVLLIHGLTGAPGEMKFLAKRLHRHYAEAISDRTFL